MDVSAERAAMTDSGRTGPVSAAQRGTLRAIAMFEAIKGVAAFAVLVGALDLMHHDVRHLAVELIGRFGMHAESRYPSLLLHYAELLPGADVRAMVLIGSGYILLRLMEAYGLWNGKAWGEWIATLSGGLYVPFEIVHLVHRPSFINAAVLAANLFLIGFMVFQLWTRRRNHAPQTASPQLGHHP